MTELTLPADADYDRARDLVRDFVDEGDEVKLYRNEMTLDAENRVMGTVVALEDDWFALQTESDSTERIRYTDLDRLSRIAEEG